MHITDFEYDGVRLSDLGYMVCTFDSQDLETISPGGELTFNTVSVLSGSKYELTSSGYGSYLETTLQICKDPCSNNDGFTISLDEFRYFMRWLHRKGFHTFRPYGDNLDSSLEDISSYGLSQTTAYYCLSESDQEPPIAPDAELTAAICGEGVCGKTICGANSMSDVWSSERQKPVEGCYQWVCYLCVYSDGSVVWSTPFCESQYYYEGSFTTVERIEQEGNLVGVEVTLVTNRPFALANPVTIEIENGSTSGVFTVEDKSDSEGFVYPHTEIFILSDGNLSIYNELEERLTYIANCLAGETITMDYPIISTSSGSHKIQNDFNWNFLRLANTFGNNENVLTVSLPCNIQMTYSPPYKIGI